MKVLKLILLGAIIIGTSCFPGLFIWSAILWFWATVELIYSALNYWELPTLSERPRRYPDISDTYSEPPEGAVKPEPPPCPPHKMEA